MPSLTTRLRHWIAARLAGATMKQVVAGVVASIGVAGTLAWTWIWSHFNPQFEYRAQPSDLASHFVGLAAIFHQIDKDSQLYCTGGWDQRLAQIGLRKCYRFRFEPPAAYQMIVCMHDQRSLGVATTDQLLALQYFERTLRPLQCFDTAREPGVNSYVVRLGPGAQPGVLQFANAAPQPTAFCGCTAAEIDDVAAAIGAKRK